MKRTKQHPARTFWLILLPILAASMALGAASSLVTAQTPQPTEQATRYAGAEFCANCHSDIHATWQQTRHAQAFSSPIFQQDWQKLGSQFTCLECHTTGYDAARNNYVAEGVTCEACHGPLQVGHPEAPMPFTPDASLCATCHKTTTDEWRASRHGEVSVDCQSCHNPHTQTPMAASVTALCTNCHKDPGQGFTHSTHADAGLECNNCHMYTAPSDASPIGGLVATGHTFTVGSEACIGCHRDTVHTRDTILALSGEAPGASEADPEVLRQQIQEQEAEISDLRASSTTRLYVGLAQGAIVGLLVGGVAAWIVSRRLKVFEVEVETNERA
jgi:predicted CXXCH cytochrome family protein